MRPSCVLALLACAAVHGSGADPAFAAASIRPSEAAVPFDRDGKTEISPGNLRMRDVRAFTCIKWAYGLQDSQIDGPEWLRSEHYDIVAKADRPASVDELKAMMRTLLADRFQLRFHRESRAVRAYALTVAKGGHKMKRGAEGAAPLRQNSASGTTARSISMREFADFIAGPLRTPVADLTQLDGRYDFDLDFTPYLPADGQRPDVASLMVSALRDELGLELQAQRLPLEILVVDRVEKPSAN